MSTPITIPVNFDFGPGFSSAPRAAAELQRIFNQGNNFNRISQPLGQMSRSADEFANSLKAANARVLAFGASAAVIITVQRALEGLVSSTINVEKRLTDINVVLNESRAGLQKFGAELFVTARQTGQSFDAVSDAALELSRQGLSVQETLKRTRDALVLTRLSGLDAKDSVEALTAGINSFNRTLITSTELVNKFAAVDARFAVSSADLAEALKRVGSTAQDAGVGLEELLGLVTAVQQTTARGGAVIGNAFKNIFSRLSRSTTIEDLRALGVQIDASQTGVEKLQALADAYKRVGVEQANQIKEAAGGVYQINVVAAALDQLSRKYGTYQQALAAANSATDEATLRNEALNQTLSALINRTQVNFTKLFSDIGSLSIDSPLRSLLGDFNSILESVSDGETTGGKLAESFLKGIGKFIEGPGALYLGTIALVLSKRLAGFAGDAFKQLNNIKFGDTERRLNLEKSIQSIIGNNPRIQDQILNGSLRIEDVQSRILADLRQEVVLRERIAALAQRIAPTALSSGIVINPKTNLPERRTRASGLIPTPEESIAETMGAYAAGYTPGTVKAANIKGLGRIVYNDAEKVVDIGLSQPAIIPPRNSQVSGVYRNKFQQRFGVDPYALANGYVPNFKNENNFRMRKGAFGDYEFENRFGGGVVDIFDDEAEIGAIDTKEQGKGTYKFLLSDLMSNLKQKGIKKVKGFLIPQNNKPKTDALTDQIKAAYPQLIRGRYGKSSILTIDGRAIRLAGGDAFDASLEKQANTILSSIRNGGDVDFETFLNKGLVPNFLPTGILSAYRKALKGIRSKDFELVQKSIAIGERGFATGEYDPNNNSLRVASNFSDGTPRSIEDQIHTLTHESVHRLMSSLGDGALLPKELLATNFNTGKSVSLGFRPRKAESINTALYSLFTLGGFEDAVAPRFKYDTNKGSKLFRYGGTKAEMGKLKKGLGYRPEIIPEEMLANGDFIDKDIKAREQFSKFKLTDKQIQTMRLLYARMYRASGETLSGMMYNGSIPNFSLIQGSGYSRKDTLSRLLQTAEQGSYFNTFYQDYRKTIPLEGDRKKLFNQIYASQSYGADDRLVLQFSKALFEKLNADRSNFIEIAKDFPGVGLFAGRQKALENFLQGKQTPKTGEYFKALMGDDNAIAIDRNVIATAINRTIAPGEKISPQFRERLKNEIRQVASELGFAAPINAQAAVFAGRNKKKISPPSFAPFAEILSSLRSSGSIPNFNALTSAITREAAAVNPSQIRIGQDARLVNSKNPAGIGVYNTKDEPGGLGQGIARAYAEGLNPKTYNVPNYAPKKVISGGVDPLIVSGTSGGQKFEIIVKIPELDRAAATLENAIREQKIDETVKERNDARSIARQAKIQEEERFLFNTPFRRERRLNSERNLLAQQSAFAASAPNITVPNPFGAISVPSLPGAPLATQPQTLQDRININNAVRQAQENLNRRNEDAAARDRRRLERAANSINPPQIGRIYVPNVNESRNINGGAQYVNNQGRVDDPFIRNRSTAPPIIGANGRIFITGVSDLQQRQERALRDIENQNAIRAAREAELRNRGSSIFRGRSRRAQASLLSEGLVTRDDLIGIENLRQNKLQNFGFGLSLAAPIVSQFAADALQNGRQSGRIAGAAASGLGNAFSFGATAFTATGGNPAATAIGVVIGALTGLVGVAKEAGNTIPELTDRIEKLQGQTNETARAASEYFSVSEKIKQITLGQTSATKGQLNELQNTQTAAFLSLPQEIREIVKTSVANDDVEGAYRAIDRVQVLVTQQANLLQEIVKIQTANKDLNFNQNLNRNRSGFLGISGRNLSEFTKFSIDNPLLGGFQLGGFRGEATDLRKLTRVISNNSLSDLALGAVDSLGFDLSNPNGRSLANEVFDTSVLTAGEQKDLLRERRQFNRSNRSVINQLIGFTNESGANFAEVASQDPAFQEALATKNTSQIIKQAKEVAKKNNFNFLAISEFLTDYTESVSNVQFDLLANAAQALSKGKFDEAKQLGEKFRADINKRENVKFNIDRNFGNYFDNLSEIGRRQSVVFDNSTANLSLQNRIGAISAEGFFDRQNLLGGERTAIINRGALSQRVAGNQFQENLLGANQSFASNSFRDIAQTLKEATDKISINAQGSNGTAEQRQNRLNAVRSLFTEQLGLNPETLNADKLTPQTVTALIAKVRDSERTLLTARDNGQTISANGIALTNQDINSILNEYSQLTKKLNNNLTELTTTSNKANQAYKGSVEEILKETSERIRTKNAQEAFTLSLEKAAFTFGNETSLRNARFETGQTARNANNTISNLGLVGFDRIRAEGAFSLEQIQARARFGLGQSERSLIGQALGQKDAFSNDLSAAGVSDLAGVNQRISALSLNTDPQSVDILNKYKSLQQQIIAQQNEINSLLPEQLAQERELIKLKEQELRFSTAFSDERARLNLSGVEGRIRTGQGIGLGDFRQTVGDQFNYTTKDFQRDAINGTAEVASTIKSSFASATADVIKNGKNIKEALTGVLTGVLDKIIDKTTEISTGFLFSGLKAVAGFSAGGPVLEGSGVRDDVPALLTKGEFVIKKEAVQKIGLQNLQKLNSGVNINLRNEFAYDDERRPTRGQQNIDPNLSVIGLTDTEISRTNQLKFAREQELAAYLNDYKNYQQSKNDAMKAYADQKRNRLYGSLISAGVGVAGAGFSSYFQSVGVRGNTNAGVRGGIDYNYRSNPYSSGIANVASGGVMFGGTSSSDVVPARLTRGEFVVNKSTVDRVGVNVFKSINNGYESGGLVRSPVVMPQKSTLAMAQPTSQNNTNISNQSTNNISINVNITSDGKVSTSVSEDNKKKSEQGKALGELISNKVREAMVKESAQGGLLYTMVRANK